jgi:hypothetical protein
MKPSGYFDVYQGTDGSPSYIQIKPELADKTTVCLYTLPDLLAALREVSPEMLVAGTVGIDQPPEIARSIFLAMLFAFERRWRRNDT